MSSKDGGLLLVIFVWQSENGSHSRPGWRMWACSPPHTDKKRLELQPPQTGQALIGLLDNLGCTGEVSGDVQAQVCDVHFHSCSSDESCSLAARSNLGFCPRTWTRAWDTWTIHLTASSSGGVGGTLKPSKHQSLHVISCILLLIYLRVILF